MPLKEVYLPNMKQGGGSLSSWFQLQDRVCFKMEKQGADSWALHLCTTHLVSPPWSHGVRPRLGTGWDLVNFPCSNIGRTSIIWSYFGKQEKLGCYLMGKLRRHNVSKQNLLPVHRNLVEMTLLGWLWLGQCWSGFGTGMCNSHWFQPGRNTWIYGIILPGIWEYCISWWLTLNSSAVKPAEYFQSTEAFLCQFSYFRALRSPQGAKEQNPIPAGMWRPLEYTRSRH